MVTPKTELTQVVRFARYWQAGLTLLSVFFLRLSALQAEEIFECYPVITTDSLPSATVGSPYSAALAAAGGRPPYRWEISRGTLPAGLSLSTGGTISGTPSATGTFDIEFRVLNQDDDLHTTRYLALTVLSAEHWSYDPGRQTLSHGNTPWVLRVAAGGTNLTVTGINNLPPEPAPLPLGDPVGGGFVITEIGASAFAWEYKIAGDLVIPDTVTHIHDFAFCCSLDNENSGTLTLGRNVIYIGKQAFDRNNFRGDLTIPDSVTAIDVYAFSSNFSRKESNYGRLSLGSGLRSIGYGAFAGCDGLVGNLTLPQGILSIDAYAFDGCYGLLSVTVPSSVSVIGARAFFEPVGLKHVVYEGEYPVSVGTGLYDYSHSVTSYVYAAHADSWQAHVESGSLATGDAIWQGNPIRLCDALFIPVTVTLDARGGILDASGVQAVRTDLPYGLLPSPSRKGFYFGGWWIGAEDAAFPVVFSSTVTTRTNHTLVARWYDPAAPGRWTYSPTGQTLSHSDITWVLQVATEDGIHLSVGAVVTAPSTPAPLPLSAPVEGGRVISSIADGAFYACQKLSGSLVIPETVTSIGAHAFSYSDFFDGPLVVSGSVTNIGVWALQLDYVETMIFLEESPPACGSVFGWSATFYIPAAHAAGWNPHVGNGPVEAGDATWLGRPIRLLEGSGLTTRYTSEQVPYDWLSGYAGLVENGDFETAAWGDPDRDGMATWAEYVAGTDPTNDVSVFRVTIDAGRSVHWLPDLTPDCAYTVEGKADLRDSAWGTTNAASRFFRVRVERRQP